MGLRESRRRCLASGIAERRETTRGGERAVDATERYDEGERRQLREACASQRFPFHQASIFGPLIEPGARRRLSAMTGTGAARFIRVLVGVPLAAVALGGLSASAAPTSAVAGAYRLVVASDRDGGGLRAYSMRPDGSRLTPLLPHSKPATGSSSRETAAPSRTSDLARSRSRVRTVPGSAHSGCRAVPIWRLSRGTADCSRFPQQRGSCGLRRPTGAACGSSHRRHSSTTSIGRRTGRRSPSSARLPPAITETH